MTKTELEEKIKNGESVWVANKYCIPYKVNLTNNYYIDIADNKESLMLAHIDDVELIDYLEYIFGTKEKAQHYHYHANITRVEHLPFLTWEEFLSEEGISFISAEGISFISAEGFRCCLYYDKVDDMIYLDKGYETDTYGATKANFYKAYDECVRLFKE